MARRYLEVGEIIPQGTIFEANGTHVLSMLYGQAIRQMDVGMYYIEVPDTLPPEVIALMTEIKSHLTSAQQLIQTLETQLNTMEMPCE